MQRETPSFEALLQGLMNLGVCLYPTAPESRIRELRDDLAQIQERCASVKNSIKHRQFMFYIYCTEPSIFFPFKVTVCRLWLVGAFRCCTIIVYIKL